MRRQRMAYAGRTSMTISLNSGNGRRNTRGTTRRARREPEKAGGTRGTRSLLSGRGSLVSPSRHGVAQVVEDRERALLRQGVELVLRLPRLRCRRHPDEPVPSSRSSEISALHINGTHTLVGRVRNFGSPDLSPDPA